MKQERRKNKKWIWLVAGLAALLVVVGVVLALVLPGLKGPDSEGVDAELYWNVDRLQYTENAEIEGSSDRTAAEDGNYYIRYAYKGQQMDLQIVDKQLVNWLDQRDLVGLIFDSQGVVVDAVEPEEVATKSFQSNYVRAINGNEITINSSSAMNGMESVIVLTENTGVYDVDRKAEVVGAHAELGILDQILVYSNDEGEVTHVYITERCPNAGIYWRLERMWDSAKAMTTRVPDENGVYTIAFAHEGEHVELKTKSLELVNYVDSQAPLTAMFAPIFDEEGYIIEFVSVALSLRGTLKCVDYHVTAIDGDNFTVKKLSAGAEQGKEVNLTLNDTCKMYMCCDGCYEHLQGEKITELKLYDRVYIYTDLEGNPVMIFVARRMADCDLYFNLERKYSGGKTTREPVNGYYVYEMASEGKKVTLRTKDEQIANEIDAVPHQAMGLKVNGSIIERVYPLYCANGGGDYGSNRYVTMQTGPVFEATFHQDFENKTTCVMSADCKIYDVTTDFYGVNVGEETTFDLYDKVTYLKDMNGEISTVFVIGRYVENAQIYYNMSRKYDSKTESTTREPDENGYYVFDMICRGKQVQVKTKNKSIASFIDKQSAPIVALKVSGGIVKEAYPAASSIKYGYKTANYQYVDKINKDGTFTTYWISNGEKFYSTYVFKMTDDCVVYNVSTGYSKARGEKTTLRVGDQIQAFAVYPAAWPDADITEIYVLNRKLDSPLYKNVQQMYDWDKLETTRQPNADGWYIFNLAANGEVKQFKTKDKDIATQVDSYELGFTMATDGDIIIRAASPTLCEGVYTSTGSYHDVMSINGNKATLVRNQPNVADEKYKTTTEVTFAKDCIYYDYSAYAEKFGAETTLSVGDRVHCYLNTEGEVIICFILYKNTHEKGHVSYCEHCKQEVFWNPYYGSIGSRDAHYYVTHDGLVKYQGTVAAENDVVLDLNGHDMTTNGYALLVNGKMSIVDTVGGGSIRAASTAGDTGGTIRVKGIGNLNICGGTFSDGIFLYDNAKVTLSGNPVIDGSGIAVPEGMKLTLGNLTKGASILVSATGVFTEETPNAAAYAGYFKPVGKNAEIVAEGNALSYVITGQADPQDVIKEADSALANKWCPVCQKTVTWTQVRGQVYGPVNGGHYYFEDAEDSDSTYVLYDLINWMGNDAAGYTVCLNLNGKTVTTGRRMTVSSGTVNIINGGVLLGTGENTTNVTGTLTISGGTVNLYGGTYQSTDDDGAPAIKITDGTVNLYDAVVNGGIDLTGGVVNLHGSSKVVGFNGELTDNINVVRGKLVVGSDWTGTASASFPRITDKVVAEANGASEGAYTGKLYLEATGSPEIAGQDGKLVIIGDYDGGDDEVVDDVTRIIEEAKTARVDNWCPVCQKTVTWSQVRGQVYGPENGGHYYFQDAAASGTTYVLYDLINWMNNENAGYTVCLNLNGYNVTTGRRMTISSGTVNIINGGVILGTGENATNVTGTLTVSGGTVNLYGGTYQSKDDDGAPAIKITDGTVNLYNAVVNGRIDLTGGVVNLHGSTNVVGFNGELTDNIEVVRGKLVVGANWTGTASVSFPTITNKVVAEANGASEGAYTGKLYLEDTDGIQILGEDGKLVVSGDYDGGDDEVVDEVAKIIEEAKTARADNWCPVCQKTVTWTRAKAQVYGVTDGGHYYFEDDAASGTTYTLYDLINWLGNENAGYTVCLNLNGYNVTTGRRMTVSSGTVNIINGGVLLGTGANATNVTGTLTVSGGTVNLYGGTYQSTAPNGAPAINMTGANTVVNLYNATVNGRIDLTEGTLNMYGTSKVVGMNGELTGNINVTGGKLVVGANWTGTASASFPSISNRVVAEANGASEGAYTGKLYLEATGNPEIAGQEGKLVIVGDYNGGDDEVVDEITKIIEEAKTARAKNWCPVCQKTVTWTQVKSQVYAPVDGGHYYFQDADATGTTNCKYDLINWVGNENAGYTVCLNLNGYNVVTERRMTVSSGTVNIINGGVLLGNGLNTTNVTGTLTVSGGTVNLYGGTYQSTDDGGAPAINITGANTAVNLYNATVNGRIDLTEGTLNMYGTSKVVGMNGELTDNINVTGGKLMVGANWTGLASAKFSTITDNVVNEANGSSEGAYTGTLYLEGGNSKIIAQDGKLVVEVSNTDKIIEEAKTARADKWCPVCQKAVTWTRTKGQVYGPVDGGHYYFQDDAASGTTNCKYDLINWLGNENAGYTVCLNLNGYNVITERRMTVSSGTVNIINGGVLLGNGLNTTNVTGTLTVSGGTVNLYGGTYQSTDDGGAPAINMTGANTVVNLYNATVNGRIDLTEGTLNMYGTSKVVGMNGELVNNIKVTGGKLVVDAGWIGKASVSFANLTGDTVPVGNGVSTGNYYGSLLLEDEELSPVVAKNGGLVVKYANPAAHDGVLKILAIGNSYAVDSTNLLYEIYQAENPDKQIVIGVLNSAGASLQFHVNAINDKTAQYYYHKLDSAIDVSIGKWQIAEKATFLDALKNEQWDIVTMQQQSVHTPNADTYNANIGTIRRYVSTTLGYEPEFAWNFTWAYPDDDELLSTNATTAQNLKDNYGTSEAMYNKINQAVQEKVVNGAYSFDYLMPVGTAIQNARVLGLTAKDLYRDALHLNNLGRLVAAYTWYCELEGVTLTDLKLTQIPAALALTGAVSNGVTELDDTLEAIVIESVNGAMSDPFTVITKP